MESEEQRKEDLEELEKYMKTKKYMEEVAKTKLGLVYPNEILIQPENK
jgi:cell division protein DivIC